MKKLLLVSFSFILLHAANAQQTWTSHANVDKVQTDKAVARKSFPKEFKLFDLNIAPLRLQLFSLANKNSSRNPVIISLPNAGGSIEQFEMSEASNFEPDLQARFPEIRAYSGRGISDKSATLKLSISPAGVQTMVFRSNYENEFIEAYSKDHSVYAVFKSQRNPGQLPWSCTTDDKQSFADINAKVNSVSSLTGGSTGQLRTMRLAQSCNGEYSNYFGATSSADVALVLAAFNATLTRCNGVYEKDLALHLNLISNTTSVIFYVPATDPYSTLSNWNQELQTTLTNTIGDANYDIGHMFGATGGGGNAGCIGCVCVNPTSSAKLGKGSGITSPADGIPQGDNFDIDYVVHEVGHQLGANHTFSYSLEGTGQNKEIGSGITIMGYAGITAYDPAPHSIASYHETSIAQIQANLATKACPVVTNISATNATPVIAPVSNYTIPISTPFALTGSATDANGDALTYSWEQDDNSTVSGANSKASPTKTNGPNFLSFTPTTSGTRLFPMLSTILAGGLTTGPLAGGDAGITIEALSSVARPLNFRLTVRDNSPYSSTAPIKVGQTAFADVVVTVSAASGPFAVTAPNTAVTYAGGSSQNITWSVASTTATPVSCANVKISLSVDGGLTFPTILAASTANDGTEILTIPNTPTTSARIKVEAVGNIFFDISNADFTISAGTSCGSPTGLTSSSITTSGATVSWTAVAGASSYDVDYKLTSASTWTNAATATSGTSVIISGLNSSTVYDWRVRTNCSSGSSAYTAAQFTTSGVAVCNAPTGLASSAITTNSATVSWAAVSGAVSYGVDYKLTTSSTWTSAATATTATSLSLSGLTASTVYDWRVLTNCSGGSSTYSTAQFTTATAGTGGCQSIYDVSTNGTTSGAATIPFNTNITGLISPITDVDNYKFVITTGGTITLSLSTLPSNYDLQLLNSSGTQVAISQNGGTTSETINYSAAAGTYYAHVFAHKRAVSSTTCYTLVVATGTATRANPTSTEVSQSALLKVYPNPAINSINVSLLGSVSTKAVLQITDAKGTLITEKKIKNSIQSVDVSRLAKGAYVIKVLNGESVITSKFIKE